MITLMDDIGRKGIERVSEDPPFLESPVRTENLICER